MQAWAILVAVVLMFGAGCTPKFSQSAEQLHKREAVSSAATQKTMTPQQLAAATARAYREASSLAFEAELRFAPPGSTLWCSVQYGPELKCDMEVRDERGVLYELHTHAHGEFVQVSEFNHRSKERAEYEVRRADFATGEKWNIRCRKNITPCMFGANLISWIGEESYKPAFFEDAISQGKCVGTELVDGVPCRVVETHRARGLTERFYLDPTTDVIRRWKHRIKGATRDRIYHDVQLSRGGPAEKTE